MMENTSREVYRKVTQIILNDMRDGEVGFNHLKYLIMKECDLDKRLKYYFIMDDGSFNYHTLSKLLQDLGFKKIGWRRWKRVKNTLPKVLRKKRKKRRKKNYN